MASEREEAFRKAVEAFNDKDLDRFVALCHPDFEWRPVLVAPPGQGAYRGHEGVRDWWEQALATWEDFHLEVTETREAGDRLAALGHITATGSESGVDVDGDLGWVVEFEPGGGLAIRGATYMSHAEALVACGVKP